MTNRGNKVAPHHRITLNDVLQDYEDGLLTIKGAIFYAVSSSRKLGEFVRLNPVRFGEQLGASRSSIYQSIAELKEHKRLDFEVDGSYLLKVPIVEDEGIPLYVFLRELSKKSDKKSEILDGKSRILDEKKSESALEADSETLQSIQSIHSSLSSQETQTESEEVVNDPEFRKWLIRKMDQLPQKPALTELWLEKQAQNEANQKEYLSYRTSLQRAKIPENIQTEEITNQAEYWKRVRERSSSQ